jgi:hypothetical protein
MDAYPVESLDGGEFLVEFLNTLLYSSTISLGIVNSYKMFSNHQVLSYSMNY